MENFEWNEDFFEKGAKNKRASGVFDHNVICLIFFLVVLMVFSLCGCANDSSSPQIPKTSAPPAVAAPATNLALDSVAGPNPNVYFVRLKWTTNTPSQPTVIYREELAGVLTFIGSADPGAAQFDDKNVKAGETYQYYAGVDAGGRPNFFGNAMITVPRDFVVNGKMPLSNLDGINRLYFLDKSVLDTSGQNVSLTVSEIISNDGTIQSFSSDQKAALGQNGRAGGSLTLKAKRGAGRLHILAQGEAGGDGANGAPGANGINGTQGQPGDWDINTALYKWLVKGFVDSFGNVMRRFPKPYTDPEWNRVFAGLPLYICSRPPSNGTPGTNGGPAQDGGTGGNGGDSTKVYVSIDELSDISVDVTSQPGLSGIGGRGGKGGAPGIGGPLGAQDQGHRCGPANQGPNGQPGMDGRQGRPGDYGSKQPACVRVANQTLYDCDKFKGDQ